VLSELQRRFYEESGYLVVEEFLSPRQCDVLAEEADRVAGGHHANLLNVHARSDAFRRLMTDPVLLRYADAIQSARMIPIGSIFFFCKPGNPLEQGSSFHQDNYAAKAPYGSYLVASVALDDAGPENGSLIVFPGTHVLRDLPAEPSKNFEFDAEGRVVAAYPIGNSVAVPDGFAPVQLRYGRGSLLFLHGHIIHGAAKNPSPTEWRRQVYFHYIKNGDPFWPGWNACRQLVERD
jgi:ectoine hydroxylase-related dioxygenase (phytanoyl-CoA dioxygenase family)